VGGAPAARRGAGTAPIFVFAGHTDVVPTGPSIDGRPHRFEPTIRASHLYGRGAADMKSSLAAMVVATERFLAEWPECPAAIAFLLTSDEEGPARHGTRAVMETLRARGLRLDWCIVGEPSSGNASATPSASAGAARSTPRCACTAAGSRRLSRSCRQPDPPGRPGTRGADRAALGRRQRILPADQLPDLEHPRRHRGHQRDSRRTRSAVQFPLLHRADCGRARTPGPRTAERPRPLATRSTGHSPENPSSPDTAGWSRQSSRRSAR
jgi:hypothetical protein